MLREIDLYSFQVLNVHLVWKSFREDKHHLREYLV